MKKVALMHANGELAQQLADAVSEYTDWVAHPYSAVVDEESKGGKLARIKAVATGDYDVIQADELVGNGPAAQAISTVTRTPVVGYLRGWGDYTNGHGQYGWKLRNKLRAKTGLLTRTMDDMAAISHAVVGGMSDMYPMHGTKVIERPYDVDYYGSGSEGAFDTKTILTVTNLRYREKWQGVKTILEGLQPVLKANPELQYAIAGDGRHKDALETDVAMHECSDQIELLGYRDDIPDLLASAELFAYVSFLDGAPSTVYEAQCAGLPIIGGDAAGVPEAVGDAGIVCPPTPKGVKRSVETLLDDSEYRERLEEQSREKMDAHNERVAQDWVNYWEGVL